MMTIGCSALAALPPWLVVWSKPTSFSFWAPGRGGMQIDCRQEQGVMPEPRVSVRWTSMLVLRFAAAALKHCRWSEWMRFDSSSANMSGSFERASQGLATHTGARPLREVSRDVTIKCTSKLMMSNKQCMGVSCWSRHCSGGTVPPDSTVQRFAIKHALQPHNTAHATTTLAQQYKSQHVKNAKIFSESLQRSKDAMKKAM
jgi:hypothetical protein